MANCDSVINVGHKQTLETLNLKRLNVRVEEKMFFVT